MAMVWVHNLCPVCGKPVDGIGILVAKVKVTSRDTYGACSNNDPKAVRPNFCKGDRTIYHETCFETLKEADG